MMKKLLILLGVVLLAGGMFYVYQRSEKAPEVTTQEVKENKEIVNVDTAETQEIVTKEPENNKKIPREKKHSDNGKEKLLKEPQKNEFNRFTALKSFGEDVELFSMRVPNNWEFNQYDLNDIDKSFSYKKGNIDEVETPKNNGSSLYVSFEKDTESINFEKLIKWTVKLSDTSTIIEKNGVKVIYLRGKSLLPTEGIHPIDLSFENRLFFLCNGYIVSVIGKSIGPDYAQELPFFEEVFNQVIPKCH